MGGLIGTGNSMKSDALAGMRRISDLEQSRENTEEALDQQDAADKKTNQMSMAASGMMIGAQVGGPYGAAIGGAIGFLAGSLF